MKRLIVVRGPMGAGKTTLCQVLLPYLQPAFWLDGDWCWKMEPFVADEAMREMVMENIAFLLGQFLRAEGKDNVLFSWVLHEDAILEDLLHRLSPLRFSLHVFNLEPGEKALVERLQGDIARGAREEDVVERALERRGHYPGLRGEHLDTSTLTPEETARVILEKLGEQ